jgi:uncharacterized protein (TIGR01244 family)
MKAPSRDWPEFPLRPGLLCAGQPDPAAWRDYAAAGYRSVVCLRPQQELPERDLAKEVAAVGMTFRRLPVDGMGDIDFHNAARLGRLLARLPVPVIVHCGSANRVGALIALQAFAGGADEEQAVALGRRAGLSGAEAHVRGLMRRPACAAPH